jgi:hypothetical protein
MKILESIPQDIKLKRRFTPCAPEAFRWIVVGVYGLLALAGLFYVGVDLWERRALSSSESEKRKLDNINAEINSIHDQSARANRLFGQYAQLQGWLGGNYAMSSILGSLFAALPENARLQEMELKNQDEGRRFALKLKLFHNAGTITPSFTGMEEKLQNQQYVLTDPEASAPGVTSDADYSIILTAPSGFYPTIRRAASGDTPLPVPSSSTEGVTP